MFMVAKKLGILVALGLAAGLSTTAQTGLDQKMENNINEWVDTYKHLHENLELSTQEKETSALIATELRKLGYEVTDHFGRYANSDVVSYGIVAVLRNSAGPTVYVRTDMDALPVTENTGLPFASKVRVKNATGEVGVMHACSHDLHMTVFLGTAKLLAESKSEWSGTVVMIGQSAEEIVGGERCYKPVFTNPWLPTGKVAWIEGPYIGGR